MAYAFEYFDSFEIPDLSKYVINGNSGGYSGVVSSGRGATYLGCAQFNSTGWLSRQVTAEVTKTQAVATSVPSGGLVKSGIFTFAETGGTVKHIYIGWNTLGQIEIRRGNGSGTILATSTNVTEVAGGYVHVEAKVTVDSSAGAVTVAVNGVVDVTISGANTRNGGTGTINECWIGTDNANFPTLFDDWIIQSSGSSTFVGDKRVLYSAANATGSNSSATPSTGASLVTTVDETGTPGDSDYDIVDNASLPKALTLNVENAPANVATILAVKPVVYARKDDAGVNTARGLVISGGTTDDGGVDITVQTVYRNVADRILTTDPNTSAAWTVSGFNAIEVGIRRIT